MTTPTITCEHCRFFDQESGDRYGFCRRRAPQPYLVHMPTDQEEEVRSALFPKLSPTDWCGEFEE